MSNVTRVRIFYPADPVGIVPGGVDTFIRGVIKWAPEDLDFSLVGMTTDPVARPTGRWTRCSLGRRDFDIFPAVQVQNAGSRTRIPLSLRYTASVASSLFSVRRGFDIFDFHRVEPSLLFSWDVRPKNAFFHQDMAVIRNTNADILWKRMPAVYEGMERFVIGRLASAWCVREDGAEALRQRNPEKSDVIKFIPTWVDTEVFKPISLEEKNRYRSQLASELDLALDSTWLVFVGRLDTQKNPALLLETVLRLIAGGERLSLLMIGDGVLRKSLEQQVAQSGAAHAVRFLGLRSPAEIRSVLITADAFALSSAYEGMPMALLEALACGLPVVTTAVGEVSRVVKPGENGAIAAGHSVNDYSVALKDLLKNLDVYGGEPAVAAIRSYVPSKVLEPVYENYRQLGRGAARGS